MKEIALSRGKFALVDDADFEWLNQWKWYAQQAGRKGQLWYAIRRGDGSHETRKSIRMHRLIIGEIPPQMEVDHRDGNGLNNQRSNLRSATRSQNRRNSRLAKSSSGFRGVQRHGKHWQAVIAIKGKVVGLGTYVSPEAAALAYDSAARQIAGEFAKVNFA